MTKDGEPLTVRLASSARERKQLNNDYFNCLWEIVPEVIDAVKDVNEKSIDKGRKRERSAATG